MMVTEFYVYRRLMQCLGYWDRSSAGYNYDPFAKQKRAGLVSSVGSAEPVLAKIPHLPANTDGLNFAVSLALWGNKMDLSLWPADTESAATDVFSSILAAATENLLHDDIPKLDAYCFDVLKRKNNSNNGDDGAAVDIIVDNAGFELVTDLALAQYLVQAGMPNGHLSTQVASHVCVGCTRKRLARYCRILRNTN